MIEIARENKAWKPLGYVSLDAFLIKEANFTQAIIDAIRNAKGGTVGEAIAKVESMPELPERGEIGNGRSRDDNVISTKQGNDTEYTLRRLKRDSPELYSEVKSGELSVNAAAIQAGIRKKPTPEERLHTPRLRPVRRLRRWKNFHLLKRQRLARKPRNPSSCRATSV
ncbi:MAG: hypothetical protein ACK6A7_08125 [Planctomycetota bacterium]